MKKVRIELKPDVKTKAILVFESSEALYLWLSEPGAPPPADGAFFIDINEGEFIEAEWRGYEIAYDGPTHRRLDAVRLAKCGPSKNSGGAIVGLHSGWTTDDQITFKDREDEDSYTITLHRPEDWRLDLGLLFQDGDDSEPDEASGNVDPPDGPK